MSLIGAQHMAISKPRGGERPEIAVACQERNPTIDAGLGDQGIARDEPCGAEPTPLLVMRRPVPNSQA